MRLQTSRDLKRVAGLGERAVALINENVVLQRRRFSTRNVDIPIAVLINVGPCRPACQRRRLNAVLIEAAETYRVGYVRHDVMGHPEVIFDYQVYSRRRLAGRCPEIALRPSLRAAFWGHCPSRNFATSVVECAR